MLGLLANNGAMASINSSVADAGDRLSQDVVAGRSGVLTCSPLVSEGYHLTHRTSIGVIIVIYTVIEI